MSLPLHLVTIALDAMPFLPMQLATFNRLKTPWTWSIVEGVADNVLDTGWCAKLSPRLSKDGTTAFITSLRGHPRVRTYQRQIWPGKTAMVNCALADIASPCCLVQVDADELWTAAQLDGLPDLIANFNCARFFMRYFVGANIVTTTVDAYGNNPGEWLRAWRFEPGMTFSRHEPPILTGINGPPERCADRQFTAALGLVPDHWAYVFPHQLQFKEEYYRYPSALALWRRLQHNTEWPVRRLRRFLPWVDERAGANLLHPNP